MEFGFVGGFLLFSKFLPVCDAGFGLVVVFVGSGSDAANTLSARPCVFVVCVTSQRVAVAVATALKPKARTPMNPIRVSMVL